MKQQRKDIVRRAYDKMKAGDCATLDDLAKAYNPVNHPDVTSGSETEEGLEFQGLLAFEDPPRPEVAPAIEYCRKNGIGVMMITGDHPATARAILGDNPRRLYRLP